MKFFNLFLFLFILFSSAASGIVIRHDKADYLYVRDTPELAAHVTFTTPQKDGTPYVVGSGTYIGNGWVLTAAHVANFFEKPDVARVNGEVLNIGKVILHEKWKDQHIGFDIALVKVSQPKAPIPPVALFDLKLQANEIVTIGGQGDSGHGIIGMQPGDYKFRIAYNKIDKVEGQWLSFTFDAPENGALEFEGVCGGGDSGSAAYIIRDGIPHIVGLSSWQDTEPTGWKQGFYGAKDYYTYINYYQKWLQKHLSQ